MDIPDNTVKLPVREGKPIGPSQPPLYEKYVKLFEKGPTPEGEAYLLELPVEKESYGQERARTQQRLMRARDAFNMRQQVRSDHLTHRISSKPGSMYVVIVKKYGPGIK